jgi:membrane-associated phospholipid phosphatase
VLSNPGLRGPALPPLLRAPLGVLALVSAVVVVALGTHVAGTGAPGHLDGLILTTVERSLPAVGPGAYRVDLAGEPVGALALMAVLSTVCIAAGRWRLAVLTVAGQGLIGVATSLVKPVVDRTIHGPNLAYPSGHTAGATAFAIVAALLLVSVLQLGRWTGVLLVLAVAAAVGCVAAWAQIVLMAHYPTDTIGGLFMAVALIPAAAMAVDAVAGRVVTVHR